MRRIIYKRHQKNYFQYTLFFRFFFRFYFLSSLTGPIMTLSPFLTPRDDIHLFSPALISTLLCNKLPEGYTLRPLRKDDFAKGD